MIEINYYLNAWHTSVWGTRKYESISGITMTQNVIGKYCQKYVNHGESLLIQEQGERPVNYFQIGNFFRSTDKEIWDCILFMSHYLFLTLTLALYVLNQRFSIKNVWENFLKI